MRLSVPTWLETFLSSIHWLSLIIFSWIRPPNFYQKLFLWRYQAFPETQKTEMDTKREIICTYRPHFLVLSKHPSIHLLNCITAFGNFMLPKFAWASQVALVVRNLPVQEMKKFIFDLFLLNFFPLGHSIIYSVSLSFQLCLFCDLSCHQILNDYIFNIQSSVGFFLNPAGLFLIVFCSLIMLILFYFFKHVIKRISYSKYDNPKTLKPLVLNLWFIVSADVHNDWLVKVKSTAAHLTSTISVV